MLLTEITSEWEPAVLNPSRKEWEQMEDERGYARGLLLPGGELLLFHADDLHQRVFNRLYDKIASYTGREPARIDLTFRYGMPTGDMSHIPEAELMMKKNKHMASVRRYAAV